jgi:hypothetical protein
MWDGEHVGNYGNFVINNKIYLNSKSHEEISGMSIEMPIVISGTNGSGERQK